MFLPLDGPAVYGALNITTTPAELKVGASAQEERKVVTVQPIDGNVYFGYNNSVTSSTGTLVRKGQFFPMEAGTALAIWLVSASGTVNVRITEIA